MVETSRQSRVPTRIVFLGGRPLTGLCLDYAVQNLSGRVEVVGAVTRESGHTGWWSRTSEEESWEVAERCSVPQIALEDVPSLDVDFMFSVLYWRRIPSEILDSTNRTNFNLHLALLPYYRGRNVFSHAIMNDEPRYGVTIHEMLSSLDTGPIVATKDFEIGPSMTAFDLNEASVALAYELFVSEIGPICDGVFESHSQDDILKSGPGESHYYAGDSLEEAKDLTALLGTPDFERHVRALEFPSFEPAYIMVGGKKVYLATRYQ